MAVRRGNALYFKTGIDNTGLAKGAAQSKGILRTLTQQITGMDVFAGIGIAAAVAFAKITSSAFKLSKDLDIAMREVQTISTAAQDDFEGMRDSVRKLAKEGPEGAKALAKALYQIVSAGYDGGEGLKVLETATKAAIAGVTDTQTAADGVTSALNAWKLGAEAAEEVSDSFFTAVRLGKTTFGELANSISLVAPMASTFGVGLDEVNSAVASLTKQGTPTAVAMTQIRQIMISLNETFGQGWRETYTFQEAVEKLAETAEESGKNVKEFTGRIEGAIGVWGLTGKNAASARKDVEEFTKKLGASAAAYEIMQKAAENQIKVMKNRWHDRLLEYGDNIIRLFGRIAEAANDKAIIQGLRDERLAINNAATAIFDLAEGTDERKSALDDLKAAYPDLFKNLDSEKTKNEDLLKVLEDVNAEYSNKIVLAGQDAAENKASRRVQRVQEDLDKLKEALIRANVELGLPGGGIDKIIEQLKELSITDQTSFTGILSVDNIQSLIQSYEFFVGKLDRVTGKQDEIIEKGDQMRKALETPTPTVIPEIIVTPKGTFLSESERAAAQRLKEEIETLSEEERKAFEQFVSDAKNAYREWEVIRKTSYAKELADDYSHYLKKGSTYKEYLQNTLRDFKGTQAERVILLKELAEIEAEELEKAKKALDNWYDRAFKALADVTTKEAEKLAKDIEKVFTDLEKNIEESLKAESSPDEVAKAYVKFGKVVFLTQDELDKLDKKTATYIDSLGQVGNAIANFGAEGNDAMQLLGEGMGAIANIASGNYLGGALQLIEAIERFRLSQEQKKLDRDAAIVEAHVASLNHEIDLLNRGLDEHLRLLAELQGTEWLKGARSSINLIEEEIRKLELAIRDTQLRFAAPKPGVSKPDENRWTDWIAAKIPGGIDAATNEQIQDYLDKYWEILLPGPRDQIQAWLNEINALGIDIQDIWKDIKLETVGFDASFITDEIISAFEAAEDGAVDFSKSFQTVMKEALVNIFKQKFLYDEIDKFYSALFAAIESPTTGRPARGTYFGGLTEEEMLALQDEWDDIMGDAQAGWNAMMKFLDSFAGPEGLVDVPGKEGLQGAIRGITEDTAGIIAGQFTAMRFNILELTEVAEDQLTTLNAIALNTWATSLILSSVNTTLTSIKKAVGGV